MEAASSAAAVGPLSGTLDTGRRKDCKMFNCITPRYNLRAHSRWRAGETNNTPTGRCIGNFGWENTDGFVEWLFWNGYCIVQLSAQVANVDIY
jgi:hypothetical protein